MQLVPDLQARFVRHEIRMEPRQFVKAAALAERPNGPYTNDDVEERVGPTEYIVDVDTLADADGVWFLCPKCFAANGGREGTHGVICWFVGKVPDDVAPKPGRWTPTGSGLHDLTFVPSAGRTQSVLLTAGCQWHGFVVNGDAA